MTTTREPHRKHMRLLGWVCAAVGAAAAAMSGSFFAPAGALGTRSGATAGAKVAPARVLPHHNWFPQPVWEKGIGRVAFSSPVVAEIDGVRAIVIGTLSGYVHVVNAATGAELPGWPRPVEIAPGRLTSIDSTPTVAYLDGPNREPSIIVGAGSLYDKFQQGGVEAFYANGARRFVFHTRDTFNEWNGGGPSGYDNSVFSTPAVGDITGNGQQDIVFGSYDHFIYALTPSGALVPGFPFNNQDTIWSSPALYDVTGTGRDDIYIGADSTGLYGCFGGWIYDLRYYGGSPHVIWRHCEAQTFWSSPAVGVINSSGRPAVVIGTSFNTRYYSPSSSDKIYAFYADDGALVPGWPVRTDGPTFGSPAIGDILGNGQPDVVDTSCAHCGNGPGRVSAWTGSGRPLWSTEVNAHEMLASPVLVDLTGSGANDVVAGNTLGVYLLNGRNGSFLYGTGPFALGRPCSVQNSAAVAFIPGVGWRLYEACGGPLYPGSLRAYPLPVAPKVAPAWPQWRGNAAHDGQESDPSQAHELTCNQNDPPAASGYRLASAGGSVLGFGFTPSCGSLAGEPVASPVVGIATTPNGSGYWLATADGAVYPFGTARLYPGENGLPALGTMQSQPLPGPVVGIVSSQDGRGYMLVGADGSVYPFGDAKYYGSMAGVSLSKPIVGMAIDPTTGGYWLCASDGGIFAFHSHFYGSTGNIHLAKPIVGMTPDPATGGYWFVASDGGIFAYHVPFYGSMGGKHLASPIVGMAVDTSSNGYWLVAASGAVYSFHAPFYGALHRGQTRTPVVAMSPV